MELFAVPNPQLVPLSILNPSLLIGPEQPVPETIVFLSTTMKESRAVLYMVFGDTDEAGFPANVLLETSTAAN
jgi:hypothetical protein